MQSFANKGRGNSSSTSRTLPSKTSKRSKNESYQAEDHLLDKLLLESQEEAVSLLEGLLNSSDQVYKVERIRLVQEEKLRKSRIELKRLVQVHLEVKRKGIDVLESVWNENNREKGLLAEMDDGFVFFFFICTEEVTGFPLQISSHTKLM
eukprot:TRINITY_DN2585_c0_g1_i6.p1 TRINITY_DN2585_c0_g1~~TRINITY_DN2585_c0_g1_i6.p1  ORF type:complete len:150 (+),score=23.61 TRINITY_DN2585_c0_g1_i6:100-549(+)